MTLLGGRYQLGAEVGHGGMARVFAARDTRMGRQVAVKVLHESLAREPSFHELFRREAQSAAALDGATIVSVYDTGEDEHGTPYIVMEYVEGRTLREVLSTEGRVLPTRALEITAEVCHALAIAHAAGIVHRDIKPANVMLTPAGAAKVMDFGIARAASAAAGTMTQSSGVVGTAAYLSPEQARGERVDARSDLYSTGCMLYELVTGVPPFRGDSPIAVAYQHVQQEPIPPSAYDDSLAPSVDAVVLAALAKAPADRYQTAEDMRADLLRAAAGQPVAAAPVARTTSQLAPSAPTSIQGGQRWLARGLLALLLLAVCGSTALTVRGLRQGSSGAFATAPDVVSLSQEEAGRRLAADGLRVGRVTPRYDKRPVGTVMEQVPAARLALSAGGTVDLLVSQGLQRSVVPALVGQSRSEVPLLLKEAGLVLRQVVEINGNLPVGVVVDVRPAARSVVPTGSEVVVVVASGKIAVPSVVRAPEQQAAATLQRAGFSVSLQPRDSTRAVGTVLSQEPSGGVAERGSVVMLVIARPPAPPEPPAVSEPGPALPAESPSPAVPAPPSAPSEPAPSEPAPSEPAPQSSPSGPAPLSSTSEPAPSEPLLPAPPAVPTTPPQLVAPTTTS